MLVVDPAGSDAHAYQQASEEARRHHRLAYATNFAVAALLRHHQEGAGGKFFITRQDDRPATASADDAAARRLVVKRAVPHLALTIAHAPEKSSVPSSTPTIVIPGNTQTSDTVALAVAQVFAQKLRAAGLGKFGIESGQPAMAEACHGRAIEVRLAHPPAGKDWRPAPEYTHRLAQVLFEALEATWTSASGELLRARRERDSAAPAIEPRDPEPSVPEGVTTEATKLARRLWPFTQPPNTVAEAEALLAAYKRQLTDDTFFWLETRVTKTEAGWNLQVRANAQELVDTAAGLLRTVGCTPLNVQRQLLPDVERLGNVLFAITLQTATLTWGAPEEGKAVQTQLLPGEPIWLLDRTDDGTFFLAHASDGYVGWVRADALAPLTSEQFSELLAAPHATLTAPWANDQWALSPGSRLALASTGEEAAKHEESRVALRVPQRDGQRVRFATLTVPKEFLTLLSHPLRGQLALESALTLYGTPYVFGGRSANGLDCSGLVGTAYEAAGLRLPRDARQMVLVGRLVATRWHRNTLQPGDILFFIDRSGRVTHTGLSMGGERFIHSCPPCVRVNSFAPSDPLYSKTWAEAFIFARRPLD